MWRASGVGPRHTFVSWLPLYHDMELIGACLCAPVVGFHLVPMSPLAFSARPQRWLEAIAQHRDKLSAVDTMHDSIAIARRRPDGEGHRVLPAPVRRRATPLMREVDAFVHALRSDAAPAMDGEQARRTKSVADCLQPQTRPARATAQPWDGSSSSAVVAVRSSVCSE
jgi:acyl-CoA synthetase (AMP-forming)/AMP-acid ligase II